MQKRKRRKKKSMNTAQKTLFDSLFALCLKIINCMKIKFMNFGDTAVTHL